jgi:hypothetical protein
MAGPEVKAFLIDWAYCALAWAGYASVTFACLVVASWMR